MNFGGLFSRIAHWFESPKGQRIERAIENAVVDAGPIVANIDKLVPNRTFDAIANAYKNYAIPFAMTELQLTDPVQQGLALRDLATNLLRMKHQDAAVSILNAAVEIAVAANTANKQ